jgi:hypothetical protein
MILRKLINPLEHPLLQPIIGSKIWTKEVEKLTQLDLLMLHARVKTFTNYDNAQIAIDLIVKKVQEAFNNSQITIINIHYQKIHKPVILLSEVRCFLERLSLHKRRALLFCLLADINPTEVSRITWKTFYGKYYSFTPEARLVAESMVRFITCPFLFYENCSELTEFEGEIYNLTCMKWEELAERFSNLIYSDVLFDKENFELFKQE